MRPLSSSLASLLIALLAVIPLAKATPLAEGACFADWSDAAPVVAHERLIAVRDIQQMARSRLAGDIVRITLCRENAEYVYRLILRDAKGRLSNLKIDAKAGLDR